MKTTRPGSFQQATTAPPGDLRKSAASLRVGREFYVVLAVAAAVIVLAGFYRTYLAPVMAGTSQTRPIVHVHGALFFAWIFLFIAQTVLIRTGRFVVHRPLGMAGALLAAGMVVIGVYVGLAASARGLASGDRVFAGSFLLITLTDMLLFAVFVGLAVANRHRPQAHKRLMVLATASLLPAPLGRLGLGEVGFALAPSSFLAAGVAHDLLTRGRIHPAYVWGGALLVAVHVLRLPLGTSATWLSIAERILSLM